MNEISFGEGTATEVLESLDRANVELASGQSIATAAPGDLVMVARLGDEVVGYIASSSNAMGAVVIWEHFVLPKFRAHGVGRRLLLETVKRSQPMASITIDPIGDFAIDQVADYYSHLGFPDDSTDRFKISVRAHQVVDTIGEQTEDTTTLEAILRRKPTEVVTVAPETSIVEAISLLNDMGIGSVVVSPDGSAIAGVLSERDIVTGIHTRGAAMLDGVVRDYMTADVISVEAGDVVSKVMELATIKRLRHLPVTKDGALVGVVSVGDLLVFRMREHDMRRDRLPYRES